MNRIAAGLALVALALGGCASAGRDMAAMHQAGAEHDCGRMHQERHAGGEECECCDHEQGAAGAQHDCRHEDDGAAQGESGPAQH